MVARSSRAMNSCPPIRVIVNVRRPSVESSVRLGALEGVWPAVPRTIIPTSSAPRTSAAPTRVNGGREEADPPARAAILNGGSRVTRSSIVSKGSLVDDSSDRSQGDDEENQEQHQEQSGEQLGHRKRCTGDGREPEQRRNDPDDQEHQSHVKHGPLTSIGPTC